jgi:hypothetical protein
MKNSLVKSEKYNGISPLARFEPSAEDGLLTRRNYKIQVLVDALRLVSQDKDISLENLVIPDACEKYGFAEGKHNLGTLLHFLADMLEE